MVFGGLFICNEINSDLELFDDIANNKDNLFDKICYGARNSMDKIVTWREVVEMYYKLYRDILDGKN